MYMLVIVIRKNFCKCQSSLSHNRCCLRQLYSFSYKVYLIYSNTVTYIYIFYHYFFSSNIHIFFLYLFLSQILFQFCTCFFFFVVVFIPSDYLWFPLAYCYRWAKSSCCMSFNLLCGDLYMYEYIYIYICKSIGFIFIIVCP